MICLLCRSAPERYRGCLAALGALIISGFFAFANASAAVAGSPAAGNTPPMAEALYQQGRSLMAAGRTEDACAKFEESHRLDPATGTLLNLAVCNEALGKTATAWAQFRAGKVASMREGRRDRVRLAAAHIARLEPRLSRLTIVVPPTNRPTDLRISLDGTVLGEAAWNVATLIDPGVHQVAASTPSAVLRTFSISIGARAENASVVVLLEKGAPAVAEGAPSSAAAPTAGNPTNRTPPAPEPALASSLAPASAGTPDEKESPESASRSADAADRAESPFDGAGDRAGSAGRPGASPGRKAAYILMGVGGAGLILGGVSSVWAISSWSQFKEECPREDACSPAGQVFSNRAQTAALVANVSLVAGAVILATGGYFFYRSRARGVESRDARGTKRDLTFTPTISSSGAGVSFGGGW